MNSHCLFDSTRQSRTVCEQIRLAGLSLLVLVGSLTGAALAEGDWKAGVARAVITPETSVWLAGYGSKRAPDGKLHDLWMKALALEDTQGHRVVLITSDFQGVPKSMSDRVFEQLHQKLKLERHQVMLTFSHNHCGPRLGDDLVDYYPIDEQQVKLIDEYTSKMVVQCVALVEQALARLAPARLRQGVGKTTFAVNRRENREAEVADLLAKGVPLKGPVDHAVPVMTVTRSDGKLEAVLFGYACHPTTLSFLTWCGDYPGFAQLEIEKNHPGATAMFVNTCGGDQNPLPRRRVELCQRYGHMLAGAVEDVLKQDLQPISPGLRTAFEYVELPYLKVVQRDELVAWQDDGNAIKKRWAARLLKKLLDGEKFSASYPYPVHAWQLGDEMLVIGMGAETVVDYALRFKKEFGPGTWVCGYADDMIAYIPSRRVWEEGGYEGGSRLYEYGRPALRWAGDIEERIARSVHQLVKQVKGKRAEQPKEDARPGAAKAGTVWKENYAVEFPGTLPVSVAFSADGKTLLAGNTDGEVMALMFAGDELRYRWKSKVEGSHAAVAFSADQKQVYATTEHGVRILDAASGKEAARIEEKDSNPTSLGVFPNKTIAETFTRAQIVFGTPRGYFVKSWAEGKLPDTVGTIETRTVVEGAQPLDEAAVPLAVDPRGRSAIMIGPIDATGEVGGVKGKNVLWAYVCGDYEPGSPGNRVMAGHIATVVSAAWAKEGGTAVTGDAAGRVIVWDAKSMKETGRLEVGGRVAALTISDDGTRTAAYVIGKQGELFVWETANPTTAMNPIHTDVGDFGTPTAHASLSFSPDGKQLAGCAIDKRWLNRLGELIGKVRVWEFAPD